MLSAYRATVAQQLLTMFPECYLKYVSCRGASYKFQQWLVKVTALPGDLASLHSRLT